jgi:nucleotide-binding universal stress UspA family protein
MFDQILFPADGSDGAAAAFDHVLDIAAAHDATVHLLFAADSTQVSNTVIRGEIVDALEEEGEQTVDEAASRAAERGVDTFTAVMQGEPYSTIVSYADSHEIDLVVMPTHGRRGLKRFLIGSTTERVVRRASVPVLTIKPDDDLPDHPYENVLVPTDGSDCAKQALSTGIDVANAEDAALHLLSVISIESLGLDVRSEIQLTALEERASNVVEDARALAADAGVDSVSTAVEQGGSIHRTILSYANEHGVDLVVAGTHGRTGFNRYVLGSVTEYLIRTSPVPVLTVRESVE